MNKLALGAARGRAAASMRRVAMSFAGMRTATVLRAPVVSAGTGIGDRGEGRGERVSEISDFRFSIFDLGRTSVSGPGQNLAASFSASSGHSLTKRLAWATLETCTISGFSGGRPLAA